MATQHDARTDPAFLATWCLPAALASALGVTRLEAATWILEQCPRAVRANGAVRSEIVARTLDVPLRTVHLDWDRMLVAGSRRRATMYPTVAQWLRENPDAEAILCAGLSAGHALHVRGGEIIEHNGHRNVRARVYAYLDLDV